VLILENCLMLIIWINLNSNDLLSMNFNELVVVVLFI